MICKEGKMRNKRYVYKCHTCGGRSWIPVTAREKSLMTLRTDTSETFSCVSCTDKAIEKIKAKIRSYSR